MHPNHSADGYQSSFVSGAATTQAKTIKGFVHSISWSIAAAATIDIYDDPDSNDTQKVHILCTAGGSLVLDMEMKNGIRMVTVGAATNGVTLTWK